MSKKAEVIETEPFSVDLRIKCKCGEVFDEVDKDMNDWAECPECKRQYKIFFNLNVELEEV